jgi:hypothetical protein
LRAEPSASGQIELWVAKHLSGVERSDKSRRVVRIDSHILCRQIAGEKLQLFAARAQRNADFIDRLRHLSMRAMVIEWARGAVAANLLLPQINIDSLRINLDA